MPFSTSQEPSSHRVRGGLPLAPLPEAKHVNVSLLMTRQVVSIGPDVSLESAVELLLDQGLSRLPVVDESGALLGVLSKTDLVTHHHLEGDAHEEDLALPPQARERVGPRGVHVHRAGPTVADAMSSQAVTVRDVDPVSRAAELMTVYQLHALPVVSLDGKLVGMLSALDIVAWVSGIG